MFQKPVTANILKEDADIKIYTQGRFQKTTPTTNSIILEPLFKPVLSNTPGIDGVYYSNECEIHGIRIQIRQVPQWTLGPGATLNPVEYHLPNLTTRTVIFKQEMLQKVAKEYWPYTLEELLAVPAEFFEPFKPEIRRKTMTYYDVIKTYAGGCTRGSNYNFYNAIAPAVGEPIWNVQPTWSNVPVAPDGFVTTMKKTNYDEIELLFNYPIKVHLSLDVDAYPKHIIKNQLMLFMYMHLDLPTGLEDGAFTWYTYVQYEIFYKAKSTLSLK